MAARKTTPRATKRKATPAQIAARKLFAERARSGELRKEKTHHAASLARRKKASSPAVKRAKNPTRTPPDRVTKVRNRRAIMEGGVAAETLASWDDHFIVQYKIGAERAWTSNGVFAMVDDAEHHARHLHREHPSWTVRVITP